MSRLTMSPKSLLLAAVALGGLASPAQAQDDPLAPLAPPPPSQPKYETPQEPAPTSPVSTRPVTTRPAPVKKAPVAAQGIGNGPVGKDPLGDGSVQSGSESGVIVVRGATQSAVVPPPLTIPTDWRGVFDAIDAGDWGGVVAGIARLPDGPLKPLAKGEYYTAKGSPRIDTAEIVALLAEAPELPMARQLAAMAQGRGETVTTGLPVQRRMVFLGSSARRQRPDAVRGDPVADQLRAQIDPLVKVDDAAGAEALFNASYALLTSEGRAEAGQRVAWIHYVLGRNEDARRVADLGRAGGSGPWAGQAAWISGLSSWRMGDCTQAVLAFREAARLVGDRDLTAAALYWAARSEQACRRPTMVTPLLRQAAAQDDNFYGLLARETLGMPTRLNQFVAPSDGAVERLPNVVRAREMVGLGRARLADELLRHQAAIGPAGQHLSLVGAANRLGLYATQYYLAHNGPAGTRVPAAARFPLAQWSPVGGWRIDPALGLAHSRQESDFRSWVVSPAGAVGLMQVLPGTAQDVARGRGTSVSSRELLQPLLNLEYGQSHIEMLGRQAATRGQLPRVIAAFNAGTAPVSRWNSIDDKGDPLLWMESLSYWETRYYVPSVLRNMFVYQGLTGRAQPQLKELAQHRWPVLPTAAR